MAEYKDIKGFKVQTVSTDPAASIIATGTWSSGGNLNTARGENFGNGVGTQTAAAVSGGSTPSAEVALHEQYNGTSWTETTDINTARGGTWADGTQGAFWMAGGAPPYKANTETWNGSAWTEVNDLNTARAYGGGTCGRSSTLGLVVAGYTGTANTGVVEQWDGTNWTEVGDLNTARRKAGGFGTSTAAFAVGAAPSASTLVESWNGTSWTETTDINTGRGAVGAAGTITDGLIYGAEQSPRTITEYWNGTSWTEVNDMGVNQGNSAGAGGTGTSAFIAGGTDGVAFVANTEEWNTTPAPSFQKENLGQVFYNSTSDAFKVTQQSVPIGSWSSGGSLNTARATFMVQSNSGGPSGQTDAIAVSGASPTAVNVGNVELYDGSAWTETTDVNTARRAGGGTGGQPAAVIAGGYIGPPGALNTGATELWNGSTWTETTDLNTARRQFTGSFGTTDSSSDLLVCGSFPPTGATEIWNGSAWTEVNDLNTGRADGASMGTSTLAGLVAGGQSSPSPIPGQTAFAESWNGTSWTEVAEFNTNRMNLGGAGAQTNGFIFGGNLDPGAFAGTELWNGTSWTELNDLALARYGNGGGGSTNAAISFGGADSGDTTVAATEEWNAGAINNTLTAS
jgi:hypothetical protein